MNDRAGVILSLRGLTKRFAGHAAVDAISLDIVEGELFTIVGPSGSGKSTLLRMLAGMEEPTGGDIILRGERINDVPANRRPTCMVFQSLALFPHKDVGANIEFALKIRGIEPRARRQRALELMRLLRLPETYYHRPVNKISGGERQRVALARALAFDPEILFFDEPLSALDYKLRKTLEKELKDIHRETKKTFVYITHSLEEAMVMSDRIGVMRDGKLVQIGTPLEIYSSPSSKFVSEFIGDVNVLKVALADSGRLKAEHIAQEIVGPPLSPGTTAAYLVVRPEYLRFLNAPNEADNHVVGRLYNEYALGSRIQYQVRVGELVFILEKLRHEAFDGRLDQEVTIGWNAADSIVVPDK
ncbi:MAG: ABC transporter ATP-binding protein [Bauldia sp.]|nr:ABC transporter ATP-binding protein [Bauldia sp.]